MTFAERGMIMEFPPFSVKYMDTMEMFKGVPAVTLNPLFEDNMIYVTNAIRNSKEWIVFHTRRIRKSKKEKKLFLHISIHHGHFQKMGKVLHMSFVLNERLTLQSYQLPEELVTSIKKKKVFIGMPLEQADGMVNNQYILYLIIATLTVAL